MYTEPPSLDLELRVELVDGLPHLVLHVHVADVELLGLGLDELLELAEADGLLRRVVVRGLRQHLQPVVARRLDALPILGVGRDGLHGLQELLVERGQGVARVRVHGQADDTGGGFERPPRERERRSPREERAARGAREHGCVGTVARAVWAAQTPLTGAARAAPAPLSPAGWDRCRSQARLCASGLRAPRVEGHLAASETVRARLEMGFQLV
mmetsp:Transcript_1717/g.5167  ORF Transcript_1717/g.5167 Transcript_1717/m.5167 type:complete len:213 (+) Transcript_1717:18-656(+)